MSFHLSSWWPARSSTCREVTQRNPNNARNLSPFETVTPKWPRGEKKLRRNRIVCSAMLGIWPLSVSSQIIQPLREPTCDRPSWSLPLKQQCRAAQNIDLNAQTNSTIGLSFRCFTLLKRKLESFWARLAWACLFTCSPNFEQHQQPLELYGENSPVYVSFCWQADNFKPAVVFLIHSVVVIMCCFQAKRFSML